MIKPEWLMPYDHEPPHEQGHIYQSWDTATKKETRHDYSVCTTWLVVGQKKYLLHVYRDKLEFPDLLRCAKVLAETWRPEAILVEDKGSGTTLIQVLRTIDSVGSIIPITPADDKVTRFNRVTPAFEAGEVYILKNAPWRADLERELLGFPNVKHDDQVDSISQFLLWERERPEFYFHVYW